MPIIIVEFLLIITSQVAKRRVTMSVVGIICDIYLNLRVIVQQKSIFIVYHIPLNETHEKCIIKIINLSCKNVM